MQNQGVPQPLPSSFYRRDPLEVARDLLGKKLVREYAGQRLEGVITEVEVYFGDGDTGSHASRGQTARNAVMFGEPGRAYVYLVYGMYWMLNVVTSPAGVAGAVLIRAMQPVRGREWMEQLRGRKIQLADGPGKLCQALAVKQEFNGWDLSLGQELWIEYHLVPRPGQVQAGPRIGIDYALPEHRDAPWRLWWRAE